MSQHSSWDAAGLSQTDLMVKDECILLNESDSIIGHGSKRDTHIFSAENPRGILHRAFSVFLFNNEGKLLLQQRASTKITFPNVWTNTCCSHPLHGFLPNEVDTERDVLSGRIPGVKAAAVRKLKHELGITIDPAEFKYLTRLHYWAADVVTHGAQSTWGEHEIDYILFAKLSSPSIEMLPNQDEVKDTKFVSFSELKKQMDPDSGLLWSPWFRIIAEKFLVHWWNDLDRTLKSDDFVDYETIYRFDPSEEHMGGAGGAGSWLGEAKYSPPALPNSSSRISAITVSNGDKLRKQGGYGKIKIHEHSLLSQLVRIDEVFCALKLKFFEPSHNSSKRDENFNFCDHILGKVSRSFASVIRQLPPGLSDDVMIFYLALRALDTVEDDMTAFKGREYDKVNHLNNFYATALVTDGWCMDGVGEGDEKVLLQQFYRCVAVYKSLSLGSQEIIADITKRMGQGMASFVSIDLGQGTVTVKDYDLYCHYVAGLVGEGLSRLFTCSGYESPQVASVSKTLANTMGLFLQKTNIIRDYLEDFVDGRAFWPKEIWGKYTVKDDLGELALPESRHNAVACLNHMITDALRCVPECMQYMECLQTEEIFRFCAIPQVMAIATLAALYNNPDVFTGVVKIRKGQAAKLIFDTGSVEGLHKWFFILSGDILNKVPANDPSAESTRAICRQIIRITSVKGSVGIADAYWSFAHSFSEVGFAASSIYLFGVLPRRTQQTSDSKCSNCTSKSSSLDLSSFHAKFSSLLKTNFDFAAASVFVGSLVGIIGYRLRSIGRTTLKKACGK